MRACAAPIAGVLPTETALCRSVDFSCVRETSILPERRAARGAGTVRNELAGRSRSEESRSLNDAQESPAENR